MSKIKEGDIVYLKGNKAMIGEVTSVEKSIAFVQNIVNIVFDNGQENIHLECDVIKIKMNIKEKHLRHLNKYKKLFLPAI